MTSRPVLIADDDAMGRKLTRRFLETMNVANPIVEAVDGDQAVTYLERAVSGDEPVPALLILDEHMPGRTGRDILEWRADHAVIHDIPVVLLTGDAIGADVEAFDGVTFLMKPVMLDEFGKAIAAADLELSG